MKKTKDISKACGRKWIAAPLLFVQLAVLSVATVAQPLLEDCAYPKIDLYDALDEPVLFSSDYLPEWKATNSSSADKNTLAGDIRFRGEAEGVLLLEDLLVDSTSTFAKGALLLNPLEGVKPRFGGELVYNDLSSQSSAEDLMFSGVVVDEFSELRAQTYLYGNWAPDLAAGLDFEGGAALEYFEIQGAGNAGESRGYAYVKPRLTLSYSRGNDQYWLLGVQRTVGDISQSGFAIVNNASVDEVWRSNPDIDPQTAWEFQAQYQKFFLSEQANIKLKAFYNQLDNVIDQVAISDTESAVGNIGSGYLRGMRLDTSVALWGGVKGSAAMVYQQSEVSDPFIEKRRDLSNVSNRQLSLGLVKAFDLLPLTTGFNYHHQSDYENQRVNEVNRVSHSQGLLDTFLEWRLPGEFSMRFDIKNLLDNTMETRRTQYQLSINDGQVESTELQSFQAGRFWGFSLSGKI